MNYRYYCDSAGDEVVVSTTSKKTSCVGSSGDVPLRQRCRQTVTSYGELHHHPTKNTMDEPWFWGYGSTIVNLGKTM